MINANMTTNGLGGGGSFFGSVKRLFAVVATFAVGALVLMAAGVVAIATAIVGLIIACVAMFMRFASHSKPQPQRARAYASSEDGVLEARRTARGWKVDG